MFNAWVDEVKKESIKVQEKYAALLKARGVKILRHQIYWYVPGYVKYITVSNLKHHPW